MDSGEQFAPLDLVRKKQMSPVEFLDISEAFLSAARLMDSASKIP